MFSYSFISFIYFIRLFYFILFLFFILFLLFYFFLLLSAVRRLIHLSRLFILYVYFVLFYFYFFIFLLLSAVRHPQSAVLIRRPDPHFTESRWAQRDTTLQENITFSV